MTKYRFLTIITSINVLVALGFAIAGAINPSLIVPTHDAKDASAEIFALYTLARALPIVLLTLVVIFQKKGKAHIVVIALLAGLIQLMDGFIGIYIHELAKTIGPFILSALTFLAIFLVRNVKTS